MMVGLPVQLQLSAQQLVDLSLLGFKPLTGHGSSVSSMYKRPKRLTYSIRDFSPSTTYSRRARQLLTKKWALNEPRHEKTVFLHMRKQRRRSASR